jgi:cell division septation protein DedD
VVYLVLDASSSTAKDMDKIRNAAKFYVEKLYNELASIPAPPTPLVSTNTSDLFSTGEQDVSSEKPIAPDFSVKLVDPSDKSTVVDFSDKPVAADPSAKPVSPGSSVEPTAPGSAPHSAFWVQLGAYRESANTNEALRILQSKGYKPRILDFPYSNLSFVQAGPFETEGLAEKARRDLRRTPGWFSDCYVYSD